MDGKGGGGGVGGRASPLDSPLPATITLKIMHSKTTQSMYVTVTFPPNRTKNHNWQHTGQSLFSIIKVPMFLQ